MIKKSNNVYGYRPLPDKIPDKPNTVCVIASMLGCLFTSAAASIFFTVSIMAGVFAVLLAFLVSVCILGSIAGIWPYMLYKSTNLVKR